MKLVPSSLGLGCRGVGTLLNVGKGTNFSRNKKLGGNGEVVGSGSALTEFIFTKYVFGGVASITLFRFV